MLQDNMIVAHYNQLLLHAENVFKLALSVHSSVHTSQEPLQCLDIFVWGKYQADREELFLSKEEEKNAAAALEHCGIYIMTIQIDTVLSKTVENRFKHSDPDIQGASWIARLIRNAFAHNPLYPVWITYPECDSQVYQVRNIITLNTTGLNGEKIKRQHYGGPIAILKLSRIFR